MLESAETNGIVHGAAAALAMAVVNPPPQDSGHVPPAGHDGAAPKGSRQGGTSSLVMHSAGVGPPVILLHGLTSSHREWTGLKTALMRNFTCMAWDARGHGTHDTGDAPLAVRELADDLAAVVRSLGPRRPVLVGHSLGAVTILEFVRTYGCAALAGIALVDHTPRMLTGPGWELGVHSGFTPADNLAFEWQVRCDPAEAYLRLLAYGFNAQLRAAYEADADIVRRLRERLRDMPVAPWLSLWKSFAHKDYREDIATLTVPLLAVLGGASNFYDAVRLGRWFSETLPHTEVIRYDGADHAPHLAAPARFARDIARFATRCTQPASKHVGCCEAPAMYGAGGNFASLPVRAAMPA